MIIKNYRKFNPFCKKDKFKGVNEYNASLTLEFIFN